MHTIKSEVRRVNLIQKRVIVMILKIGIWPQDDSYRQVLQEVTRVPSDLTQPVENSSQTWAPSTRVESAETIVSTRQDYFNLSKMR